MPMARAPFPRRVPTALRRFLRDQRGAVLVEFAISLPLMLLVFAVIIEGSRMMLSYQSAIAGVRDATRFLSRVAPADICTIGGSVAGYEEQLALIVGESLSGRSVFPQAVTVDDVTSALACVEGDYRYSPAGVASVTAELTISFPFAGIFTFLGQERPELTATVTDSARIYGS
jgi:Flp pilus assembly pilin Flp